MVRKIFYCLLILAATINRTVFDLVDFVSGLNLSRSTALYMVTMRSFSTGYYILKYQSVGMRIGSYNISK
jgi:hypothetical protein